MGGGWPRPNNRKRKILAYLDHAGRVLKYESPFTDPYINVKVKTGTLCRERGKRHGSTKKPETQT